MYCAHFAHQNAVRRIRREQNTLISASECALAGVRLQNSVQECFFVYACVCIRRHIALAHSSAHGRVEEPKLMHYSARVAWDYDTERCAIRPSVHPLSFHTTKPSSSLSFTLSLSLSLSHCVSAQHTIAIMFCISEHLQTNVPALVQSWWWPKPMRMRSMRSTRMCLV